MLSDPFSAAWTYHRSTSLLDYLGTSFGPGAPPADAAFVEWGAMKEYPTAPRIPLPPPSLPEAALGTTIRERASCRRFVGEPLSSTQIGTLLASAYGISTGSTDRPVPSAGGSYPLEVYLLVPRDLRGATGGIYHYAVRAHALERIAPRPQPAELVTLFLNQPWLSEAGAIVVLTAVPTRILWRYGDRGYRYLLLEAGHVGQNLALGAAALGTGCLSLGGFVDEALVRLLGIDPAMEMPLYGLALGQRQTEDRIAARGLEPATG